MQTLRCSVLSLRRSACGHGGLKARGFLLPARFSHSKPAPSKAHAMIKSFPHLSRLSTIWMTNDAYKHANNSSYGEVFDTAVNAYLIRRGAMDFDPERRARLLPSTRDEQPVIGFMIESGYRFFDSFAYPETVAVGVRVAKVGRSSVRYEAALFRELDPDWRDPAGKLMRLAAPGKGDRGDGDDHLPPASRWLPDEALNLSLSSGQPSPGAAAEAYLARFRSEPSASGFFVHVYVDPETKRPVKDLPQSLKDALVPLVFDAATAAPSAAPSAAAAADQ